MRHALVLAALLAAAPLAAQAPAAAPAAPAGWQVRLDRANAPAAPTFVSMGGGMHVTAGPAAIYFDPANRASGNYSVKATFTQTKAPTHPEAYGLISSGTDLDSAGTQQYMYLIVRGDGKFALKHRAGAEVHTLIDWTEHAAVQKQDAAGKATNALEIRATADRTAYLVNGVEVAGFPRRAGDGAGIVGMRVNHNLDVHVAGFALERLP
jgi:hypothetical protein